MSTNDDQVRQLSIELAFEKKEVERLRKFYISHVEQEDLRKAEIPVIPPSQRAMEARALQKALREQGGDRYRHCKVFFWTDGVTVTIENIIGAKPLNRWYPVIYRVINKMRRGEAA